MISSDLFYPKEKKNKELEPGFQKNGSQEGEGEKNAANGLCCFARSIYDCMLDHIKKIG